MKLKTQKKNNNSQLLQMFLKLLQKELYPISINYLKK